MLHPKSTNLRELHKGRNVVRTVALLKTPPTASPYSSHFLVPYPIFVPSPIHNNYHRYSSFSLVKSIYKCLNTSRSTDSQQSMSTPFPSLFFLSGRLLLFFTGIVLSLAYKQHTYTLTNRGPLTEPS